MLWTCRGGAAGRGARGEWGGGRGESDDHDALGGDAGALAGEDVEDGVGAPGEKEAAREQVDALGDALGLVGAAVEEARGGRPENGEGDGEDDEDGDDSENKEHPLEAQVRGERGGEAKYKHDLAGND